MKEGPRLCSFWCWELRHPSLKLWPITNIFNVVNVWNALTTADPTRCGAQCKTWARGPIQRPKNGALVSNYFMTSSCSINRVTIVVERRYTEQH